MSSEPAVDEVETATKMSVDTGAQFRTVESIAQAEDDAGQVGQEDDQSVWLQHVNESGVPYYFNEQTGVSTWERPLLGRVVQAEVEDGQTQIESGLSDKAVHEETFVESAMDMEQDSTESLDKPRKRISILEKKINA